MPSRRIKKVGTKRLFRDQSGQEQMFEKSLEEELEAKKNAPVECLGMTFPNDEERRKYYLEKLREKRSSARSKDSPSARTRTSWRCLSRRTTPPAQTRSSRISSSTAVSPTIQKPTTTVGSPFQLCQKTRPQIDRKVYKERTSRIPASISAILSEFSFPALLVKKDLSSVINCETLATDLLGSPESFLDKRTFPGAPVN